MLNGLTIRLRSLVSDHPNVFGMAIIFMIVFSIGDVVADVFMPKGVIWNCIRTVLALVTAVPMFMSGYFIGLKIHDASVKSAEEDGVDYIEYRLRRSANARYRRAFIALCVIALIGVLTYDTVIYTVSAAAVISMVIAVILYCRLTPDEKILNEYGTPDPRDLIDEEAEEDAKITLQANRELRREKINERKRMLKREDEDDDEDVDHVDGDLDSDDDDVDYQDDDQDDDDDRPRGKRRRHARTPSPLRP